MRKLSPLELSMMMIYDCALDIENTAYLMGDTKYGRAEQTRAYMELHAMTLRKIYSQLRELTGAHPCK